jgi:lysophospholipase L1-like esterase
LTRRRLLASSGAALAATGLPMPGMNHHFVHARQATPAATPSPQNPAAFAVQYFHFEKMLAGFGIPIDDDLLATMYGIDVPTLHAIRQQFDDAVRQAAEDLLADPDFADRVSQLPFEPGSTVVGLGDSITDDLQSWLEILRHLLALQRPDDQIQIINQGISGDTTSDAIPRMIEVVAADPAWIITMLGTNDACRFGLEPTKPAVSAEESTANLLALRHFAATESNANWAWITPPSSNPALVDAAMGPFEMSLSNDDLKPIADFLLEQPEPVADIFSRFGQPASTDLIPMDGIHPSLDGQKAIVSELVRSLTT